MSDEEQFRYRVKNIEALVREVETIADPHLRASVERLVQSLMELHGEGLRRLLEIVSRSGQAGQDIIDRSGRDELVGSLLVLYGLHPLDVETRVVQALDRVRPYLRSHGGEVRLVDTRGGTVRLELQGSCHGCASSMVTLKLAIEDAIYQAAPDVVGLEVEGVTDGHPPLGFVALSALRGDEAPKREASNGGWEDVHGLSQLSPGSVRALDIKGRSILFCRFGESMYAYRNRCSGCGLTLENAALQRTALVCPACHLTFDVVHAGRALNRPELGLEPLPLLSEGGRTKIALPLQAATTS